MIDGFLARRRPNNVHPSVKAITNHMVSGDHSQDDFRTPGEVAAAEEEHGDQGTASSLLPTGSDASETPAAGAMPPEPPKSKRPLMGWCKNLSPKGKALLSALAVIVVAGAGAGAYFLFFKKSEPAPPVVVHQEVKPEPKPTTVPSSLTGLPVKPAVNDRPVTAIMIENSMDARPQSGLNKAGVVFEAVAEGGITRFLTLFQDTEPDYIGPVRSVRPYYLTWLLGFDAAVAHAGGSGEALSLISAWHVKDLNHSSAYFWRVSSRAAPHNLYTSLAKLRQYEAQKGYGKAHFAPLARKDKEEPATTPTARIINFNISGYNYNSRFVYDKTTNSYKRFEGGAPHLDERSHAQLAPKVVIGLVMPQGKNGIYTTYKTTGSGQVFIFQDGKVTPGRWQKTNNTSNFKFTTSGGQEIKLNPGQTWFVALGGADRVSYTP